MCQDGDLLDGLSCCNALSGLMRDAYGESSLIVISSIAPFS